MASLNTRQGEAVARCPACGHPLDGEARACGLCGFSLGDKRVTGDDLTPYALAYAEGNRAWWRTSKWIWSATAERLKHLALMRSSPAARRFAVTNILLLAFASMLPQISHTGWRIVSTAASDDTAVPGPQGAGWLQILTRRHATMDAIGKRVDVWWNPARTIIAAVASFVGTLLISWLLLMVVRGLVELSHRKTYRGEQRMTAALSYGTAWIVPALPAAIVVGFLPLAWIGAATRSAAVSDTGLVILAAIIVALPSLLWWLWLVRLSGTAPADCRGAVLGFFVIGVPLLTAAAVAGWWFGLQALLNYVFFAMGLNY